MLFGIFSVVVIIAFIVGIVILAQFESYEVNNNETSLFCVNFIYTTILSGILIIMGILSSLILKKIDQITSEKTKKEEDIKLDLERPLILETEKK